MTELLTAGDFAGHLGTVFAAAEVDVALELVEVKPLPAHGAALAREPFSLLFRGPRERLLPQATYPLSHPAMGELEIFLVPIAQDAGGTSYEAIYS